MKNLDFLEEQIPNNLLEKAIICDGCNVNKITKHNCQGSNMIQFGEKINISCECDKPECKKKQNLT